MKAFSFAALVGATLAQTNYGTTGHYGNAYGNGGLKDHPDEDHDYGYDSVKADIYRNDLAEQTALKESIINDVNQANTARINYLARVFAARDQRITEIHNQNLLKIAAPFDYQMRLIAEEMDDVLSARNYAVRDANEAYDDLITRIDFFEADIKSVLSDEIADLGFMLQRAIVDRKQPCKVMNSLRIKYFQDQYTCPIAADATATAAAIIGNPKTAGELFSDYDNIFNDFHYDIGHGKGTGTGAVNGDAVTDGFRGGSGGQGGRGDRQTQQGMSSLSWESPGRVGRF